MPAVSTLTWIALVVFGAAVLGGLSAAAVEGLAAWRAFRRFRNGTGMALLEMTRRLAEAEARLAGAATKAAELDRARVQLQASLSTAAVLASAAGEAWEIYGRTRSSRSRYQLDATPRRRHR
jgi:hypothetical protein